MLRLKLNHVSKGGTGRNYTGTGASIFLDNHANGMAAHGPDPGITKPPASIVQYIPRNMHTVLLCFALLWLRNRS